MYTYIFMTLGPAKHENAAIFRRNLTFGPAKHKNVAIFRRKMSEIRMFLGLRECQTRNNP